MNSPTPKADAQAAFEAWFSATLFHGMGDKAKAQAAFEAGMDALRANRIKALTAERDALRAALHRLWPLLDKATKGYVFTAARAGEVTADMRILQDAALAARAGSCPEAEA